MPERLNVRHPFLFEMKRNDILWKSILEDIFDDLKITLIGKTPSVNELYRLKIDLANRLLSREIPKWKIGRLMNFLQFDKVGERGAG